MKYKFYKNIKNANEVIKNNTIVIEGVVGVGKSTLMNLICERLGYDPYEEPVVDNPFLAKFYGDRGRFSFPLQLFFLNERLKLIKEANSNHKSVMDRSIYGDGIFASILCNNKELSEDEYKLYLDLRDNILGYVEVPKLMIYLRCNVDTAVSRIKKRNRDYEQDTEREYWEMLNKKYEEYFKHYQKSNLLVIDVDEVDIFNEEHQNQILNIIKKYI